MLRMLFLSFFSYRFHFLCLCLCLCTWLSFGGQVSLPLPRLTPGIDTLAAEGIHICLLPSFHLLFFCALLSVYSFVLYFLLLAYSLKKTIRINQLKIRQSMKISNDELLNGKPGCEERVWWGEVESDKDFEKCGLKTK